MKILQFVQRHHAWLKLNRRYVSKVVDKMASGCGQSAIKVDAIVGLGSYTPFLVSMLEKRGCLGLSFLCI